MTAPGFRLLSGRLDAKAQARLCAEVLEAAAAAPFYRVITPSGRPMSVEMTNFGPLGWIAGRGGYAYVARHPVTGSPWPPIPALLLDLWRALIDDRVAPDACVVNRYGPGARMGLHQDRDEADMRIAILSVSLGDTALFRIGGLSRRDATTSVRLASGDVCILAGEARRAFHGVDRVISGSSRLIPGGGRLNLTLRRARSPGAFNRPCPCDEGAT